MADETADDLRREIDHLRRLAQLVTDGRVVAEIRRMIEELEQRLGEREARRSSPCDDFGTFVAGSPMALVVPVKELVQS